MLKFGQNSLNWSEIAGITRDADGAISVITTDNETFVVGQWENEDQSFAIYSMIDSARKAVVPGGVTIIIDIDDF